MDTPKSTRTRWLELIAIAACLLIVIAIVLPAIQGSRDVHRGRTICMNNLKQLSLAVTTFEIGHKRLPGIQGSFAASGSRGKLGSWVVSLLPFIELQQLRDQWDDPTKQQQWETDFTNLSSSSSKFYPEIAELFCDKSKPSIQAPLSYLANAGLYIRFESGIDPVLGLEPYQDITDASDQSAIAQRSANGAFANLLPKLVYNPRTKSDEMSFGVAKPISSRDFKDGVSNTILFAENSGNRSWADVSTTDDSVRYRVGFVWLYAGDRAASGRPNPTPLAEIAASTAKSDTPSYLNARPSSMHAEVFNAAMTDGSVQTISNNVDYVVYQALMTPHTVQSDMPDNQTLDFRLKP